MEDQDDSKAKKTGQVSLFTESLGRLFELGFNTGLLTAIEQKKLPQHFGELYRKDLHCLRFSGLIERMNEMTGVISPWDQETLQRWLLFFLQKGFLAGLNFFNEYIESFSSHKPLLEREIVYVQCSFSGKNSLGTYDKNERTAAEELLEQFRAQGLPLQWLEDDFQIYKHKGNFLNADTLLLLRYGNHWRILCVDLSVFSLRSLQDAGDLTNIEKIREILAAEWRYLRSKSTFANLSIDTNSESTSSELLSGKIQHYLTAFSRGDKESLKLIQAASYAYSFYTFLQSKGILTENDDVVFNVLGYTDRSINALSLRPEHLHLLQTCAEIYKSRPANSDIDEARSHVLDTIQKAAARSFQGGRDFVKKLVHLADHGDGLHSLTHRETIDSFTNTRTPLAPEQIAVEVRERLDPSDCEGKHILDVHAALVMKELESQTPYLFLTGHPGIGKTTAVVDFLKAREQLGEGFLFLYISPRKQVNLDIITKFRIQTALPPCANLFALTANSAIIRNNNAKPTVHYYSQQRADSFLLHGVKFLHAEGEEAKQEYIYQRHLEEIQAGLLIDRGERISGVLDSLCRGLYATIEVPLSKAIVATAAIQSLKRTANGANTLKHLDKIFQGAYSKAGGVIPSRMMQIGQHIRHFFVMIDEITGDESGVEFLEGMQQFVARYDLLNPRYGINTKIIVADASISDPQIIQQHLADSSYEPDKIYFRRVLPQQTVLPLSRQTFLFKRKPAVVINANAYPASKLTMTYRIVVDAFQYNEEKLAERDFPHIKALQQHITQDILAFLDQEPESQMLVYIQDKQRLAALIQAIQKERHGDFQKNQDYLEIHANISEMDKSEIVEYQDSVKVVFMTASASRGLSFKRAKHILIDIPHFEIEQNLMEILQVIYRGRGGGYDQEEKYLTFYLADQVIYTDDHDRALAVRECMLHLLNVLLILKTSAMTRIAGSGQIGINQRFMMIPIGGKSIFAAGETFTARMSKLIKDLTNLSHQYWGDKSLVEVCETLVRLFGNARIRLVAASSSSKGNKREPLKQSYISLIPSFSQQFEEAARKGFDHLLQWQTLEQGYLAGSMLVVPIAGLTMQEKYWMEIEHYLEQEEADFGLLAKMRQISYNLRYHDNVRMIMKDAIAFVEALKRMAQGTIQHYEQESAHADQHYALPLLTFLADDVMREYFKNQKETEAQHPLPFRSLLAGYLRALYPADSLLPIGSNYDEFPFLVFRSPNLGEARRKVFTDKYLFMSHEFNILNMLLSSKE